jgi:hypothetical protein
LHPVVEGIKASSLLENLTRQMFLGSDRFVENMQTCIDKAQDREGWWIDAIR